jgi:uncharacterized protein
MRVPHLLLALAALSLNACGGSAEANKAAQAVVASAAELPALTGRVVDQAQILPPSVEESLTARLAELERRTSDQLVVVTMESLNGESIESFGLRLGNGWGIGQRDKDNGVLLIVAPGERKVRIEVGLGLERTLTNQDCAEIIGRDILPHFKGGRMAEGVEAAAAALIRHLEEAGQPARKAA